MSKTHRDKEREQLVREVDGKEYRVLLEKLIEEHPAYSHFCTWMEVVEYLRGQSSSSQKDDLLKPILENHAQDNDPRWRTILLLSFWPGLKALCNREKTWGVDYCERWSNTVFAFLNAICNLDPAKRRHRFAQKLINDTIHALRIEREEALALAEMEEPMDNDELDKLADERSHVFTALDELRNMVDEGHLTETEFQLIVETSVHDKPLKHVACELGLSYQNGRKIRLRALKRLRIQ